MRISDWSSDVCSSDLSVTAFRSKSGVASVKLKSSPWPNQLPFQPLFHPSTSTPPKPFFAAKSIYCLVRAVVAPWLGPSAQLHGPRIIPHQMPIYFIGLNQQIGRAHV